MIPYSIHSSGFVPTVLHRLFHGGAGSHADSGGWSLRTPLHDAVCHEAVPVDVVRALASGAVVNVQDVDGYTALHLAVLKRRWEVVPVLVAHGADVNAAERWFKRTALHKAVVVKDVPVSVVSQLVSEENINAPDSEGRTALHMALSKGRVDVAERLVEHGAFVYLDMIVRTLVNFQPSDLKLLKLLLRHFSVPHTLLGVEFKLEEEKHWQVAVKFETDNNSRDAGNVAVMVEKDYSRESWMNWMANIVGGSVNYVKSLVGESNSTADGSEQSKRLVLNDHSISQEANAPTIAKDVIFRDVSHCPEALVKCMGLLLKNVCIVNEKFKSFSCTPTGDGLQELVDTTEREIREWCRRPDLLTRLCLGKIRESLKDNGFKTEELGLPQSLCDLVTYESLADELCEVLTVEHHGHEEK